MTLVLGIDATRSRSGGAKAHLKSVIVGCRPSDYGISKVHLWAYRELSDAIPEQTWLEKHVPRETTQGLAQQLWWQYFRLPKEATRLKCDLVFNSDAGSVSPFSPSATLSQDMLSFEPGEMQRYGLTKSRLRLEVLRYVQARSLQRSNLAIFLTNHAANVIQRETGNVKRFVVVPHGISDEFRFHPDQRSWPKEDEPIKILYVSNAAMYKHQWHVIRAMPIVRRSLNRDVRLLLVGGGTGIAQGKLVQALNEVDPQREFTEQKEYVPHHTLPRILQESSAFVFASSCENMPITLMEAMANGLPIACSDRGPMPEVLQSAGFYFDPESPTSIASAIIELISNSAERSDRARLAYEIASSYTWERCARETWKHLSEACRGGNESD